MSCNKTDEPGWVNFNISQISYDQCRKYNQSTKSTLEDRAKAV